jgi:hypothetical protein
VAKKKTETPLRLNEKSKLDKVQQSLDNSVRKECRNLLNRYGSKCGLRWRLYRSLLVGLKALAKEISDWCKALEGGAR